MKTKPPILGILIICTLLGIFMRATTPTTAQTNRIATNIPPAIQQSSHSTRSDDASTVNHETQLDEEVKTKVLDNTSYRKSAFRLIVSLLILILLITLACLKTETLREQHEHESSNHKP